MFTGCCFLCVVVGCVCFFLGGGGAVGGGGVNGPAGRLLGSSSPGNKPVNTFFYVALRPQRPYGLLATGSSGRPPPLSHSS